jgi:RNA polymerase sigma-70 factor (ECF subfamily)
MITSTFSSDNELSDKEFMVHLYTKYENLLFYTAQKYISERGSVEDVVQESLVKLHEKIRTIKPMPEIVLASYIRSTVRNTAINILKSAGYEEDRQISTENIIDVMDEHALSLDTLMQISRYRELLSKIWPELSKEEQFLLEGKYILGYSDRELSTELCCQPSSVRMKLTRARRHALSILASREGVNCFDEA